MALSAGTKLGPYEILAAIGAGGMGEVYRARDTRLDREVAIKILPELFAADPERVARFTREAKTLAALNHPHIAQIYGLEEAQGVSALVMELVEGPTLADLIAERVSQAPAIRASSASSSSAARASGGGAPRALEIAEALPIAKQIAEALEAAHELGIIHRDLKPANVKVRPDGTVKVLDFGLAKALDPAAGGVDGAALTNSPTITSPAAMTQRGVILGTAAYMAPEQARGKAVDRRADIWAFGCVLFEMLTGGRAFGGEDVSDTLAFVITKEPDWAALPSNTPGPIRKLLRRCLEKDRKRRLDSIADARLEIEDALVAPGAAQADGPAASARSTSATVIERVVWSVVVALLAAAIIVLVLRTTPRGTVVPPVVRFNIQPPPGEIFPGAAGTPRFSVSPDGKYVVFTSSLPGKRDQLWLRSLDGVDAKPIPGTESASLAGESTQQPFWSPDSRQIGFFDGMSQKMKKVDVQGGPVQTLCDDPPNQYGGSWNSDGVIIFSTLATNGIRRVSASGGSPVQVTSLDQSRQEISHLWPRFLPDGRHFLYHVRTAGREPSAVYVGSLDSAERKKLIESEYMAEFALPNLLLSVRGASLMAQTLDLAKLELVGEPALVAPSVLRTTVGRIAVSASDTGALVYASDPAGALDRPHYEVAWRDRSGRPIESAGTPLGSAYVRLSPNGRYLAIPDSSAAVPTDIWIEDLERKVRTRLTTDPAPDSEPVWSPDSSRVVFRSVRGSAQADGLYEKPATGAISETLLSQFEPGVRVDPLDWSADGRFVVFRKSKAPPSASIPVELWLLPLSGDRKAVPYLTNSFRNIQAAVSPNGRWLAYTTNETGRYQVVVQPFPDPSGGKWQVSSTGGLNPQWRRDGRELFYIDGGGRLTAVAVATDGAFGVSTSTPLFETSIGTSGEVWLSQYDVTADGQRFVLAIPLSIVGSTAALTVTLNWTAELKK
jgi:eukaryotic-like serine/threonine-protein kinase